MGLIKSLIVAFIFGISSIFPISSSGHIIILQNLLGLAKSDGFLAYTTLLSITVLVTLVLVFIRDIISMAKSIPCVIRYIKHRDIELTSSAKLLILLISSCIPLLIGFFLSNLMSRMFSITLFVGIAMIANAIMIIYGGSATRGRKLAQDVSIPNALVIGLFLLIATFPGASHIAAGIFAMTQSGFNRRFTVKYICLLTIPMIIGNIITSFGDITASFAAFDISIIGTIIGMFITFIIILTAIKLLEKLLANRAYRLISVYLAIVGALTIAISLL
jgi:undecaprenyl-diphosphatase